MAAASGVWRQLGTDCPTKSSLTRLVANVLNPIPLTNAVLHVMTQEDLLEDLESENCALNYIIVQLTERVQTLEGHLTLFQENGKVLQDQLTARNHDIQRLQMDLGNLQHEQLTHNSQVLVLDDQLEQSQSSLNQIRTGFDEYIAKFDQATEENIQLKSEMNTFQEEICELQFEESSLDEYIGKFHQATKENIQLKSELNTLQEEVCELRFEESISDEYIGKFRHASEENMQLKSEMNTLQGEVCELRFEESSLDEYIEKFHQATKKNIQLKSQMNNLQEQVCELRFEESSFDEYIGTFHQATEENIQLKSEMNSLQEQVCELQIEESSLDEYIRKFDQATEENLQLKSQMNILQEQVWELRSEQSEKNVELTCLKSELGTMQGIINRNKQAMLDSLNEITMEKNKLKQELWKKQEMLQKSESGIAKYEYEMQILKEQVEFSKYQINTLMQ